MRHQAKMIKIAKSYVQEYNTTPLSGDTQKNNYSGYYSDVKWASIHLNSPAPRLSDQQFIQVDIKVNIKAPHQSIGEFPS